MKQVVWIVGGLVGFLLVIGMGYSIGQIISVSNDIAAIDLRLSAVEQNGGSGSSGPLNLKVGVVRVNEIGLKLQDDPQIVAQLQQQSGPITNQLRQLQQRLQGGQISEEEYTTQVTPLNAQLEAIFQEILLRPIQNAVNQVAMSGDYDLVIKVEDVILFAQGNIMEDITDTVWTQIQRSR